MEISLNNNFLLHKAIASKNLTLIEQILLENSQTTNNNEIKNDNIDIINQKDWHGNAPLHIACHLRYIEAVELLLKYGAKPTLKNGGGFSVLQEAVASGDRNIIKIIYKSIHFYVQKQYKKKLPILLKELEKFPDFYCELKWEFKSWVPFVSNLCPHDTYKIYKKGSSFRVDTTLVGFKDLKWQRGNVSFLFLGSESDNKAKGLVLMDHQKKTVEYASESLKELSEEEIEIEIDELMKNHQFFHTDINSKKISFSPSLGWFGSEKFEKIGNFNAKLFQMSGFEYTITYRTKDKKHTKNENESGIKLPADYFERPTDDPKGKGYGLLYEDEKITKKTKTLKGTLYLSQDFPHTIEELFPIIEAPNNKHFKKLKEFLQLKFPEFGFPIKIDIPIFPTISGIVTFLEFEHKQLNHSLFQIPEDYNVSKIQLNFQFDEKDEEKIDEKELEEIKLLNNNKK